MIKKLPVTVLLADDDPEDQLLVSDAFEESSQNTELRVVSDGEELLEYLFHKGNYSDPESAPRPGLILLDLNMPRKDGRQLLKELKTDARFKTIPVIVLSTSGAIEDIVSSYENGASSFIVKPPTFSQLVEAVRNLGNYWFQTVQLPSRSPEM